MITVEFEKLKESVKLPTYAHKGDAGLDVYSTERKELGLGEQHLFKSGFAMKFPETHVCHVWPKSGLAHKHGIDVMAGVIDSSYRGEVGIILRNTGKKPYIVEKGDKIAQLVFTKIAVPTVKEVDDIDNTKRGSSGFGSTGK